MAQVHQAESPIRARLEALEVGETLPYSEAPVVLEKGREAFRLWVMREQMEFRDFELTDGIWKRVA